MGKNYSAPKEFALDINDLLWKLLMQWKAILIACIFFSLVFTGIKYNDDRNTYNEALAKSKSAEAQASKPASEQIEDALSPLPSSQRATVLFLVQQQDMITIQENYLNNSLLLNFNPSDQRQLSIKYLLKSDTETNMRTLVDSYNTCLHGADFLESLREIISPDTSIEYIDELIDTANDTIVSGNTDTALYAVTIILPDDVDSAVVLDLVNSKLINYHEESKSILEEHSISMIDSEENRVFNSDIMTRRSNLTTSVNSLTTSLETSKARLSEQQRSAFDSISAIKQAENALPENEPAPLIQPPEISMKTALLGFLIGAFIYSFIYVTLLVIRKELCSAHTAQTYTGTRLLGELYVISDHKGLMQLFTSKRLAKWRYRDKLNETKQIEAMSSVIDAICSHHEIDSITLLRSGIDNEFEEQLNHISSSIDNIKNLTILNTDTMEGKSLASITNGAYIVCSKSKADALSNLISLVNDYEIDAIGTIYLEKL